MRVKSVEHIQEHVETIFKFLTLVASFSRGKEILRLVFYQSKGGFPVMAETTRKLAASIR